ncbi:MAG TPA: glucosyl-3-phosphoglycerate synthase [Thermoleophilaceae bacterium]|nr:glucosyl-3-phosphoglycerate synthase [Thermoleophilaceae bacterium]
MIRSFHHSQYALERLLEGKRETVTVVLPTREVADTIGPIVERLRGLAPLIDQILVVDAASGDGTAEIAAARGAEVHQESELLPDFGPVLGKGDAMWRALAVARGELVVYLDSDTPDFSPHFATGLLGPLVCERDVRFVKGHFRRPFTAPDGREYPSDGGRVTELTAKPLLSAFFPDLAGFIQPLAGEVAAPRELFERLPFATGYAVETAMLLHARDALGGTDGMAQVDLELRRNRHQPLSDLAPMAREVLGAVLERLAAEGRLLQGGHEPPVERPPYATLSAHA